MIKLENKLYSSTEVAEILGVSLRSVYRYLEEDKLTAEVKTATGRHRFTRQNIIDFLYPKGIPEEEQAKINAQEGTDEDDEPEIEEDEEEIKPAPKVEVHIKEEPKKEEPKVEVSEEESVDWLSKFREAAKKFEDEPEVAEKVEEVTGLASDVIEGTTEGSQEMFYYRSRLGGLKDIAQNIDKTARNSGLDYAFTMNAGLSLYKPISPFSVLHAYIRSKDKDFFERILTLTPSDEGNAQLCLVVSDEDSIYKGIDELHGLKVVEKKRLVEDIGELDEKLLKEAEGILQ
ncbi:helix-turn-helix domain-containing protein [Patescibacteria group bacterium]|nr:helix-turn-helix domain-containing protein [Patescibacteria group bacterium]